MSINLIKHALMEQAGNEGGGAAPVTPVETATPPADVVSKAEFEKVMSELHKHKAKAKSLEDKVNEDKMSRMKEQNQWKEIAEAKEREAAEARERAEKVQSSFLSEKKYTAAREKCMALGIRAEALSDLEMLDLESIQIETTSTGKINVLGADKFAERLKTTKPHWFQEKKATTVNTDATRVIDQGGTVTPQMIMEAEKEARKTGDTSKYHDLHKRFQQQRLARR
jgi:hypothetical protein